MEAVRHTLIQLSPSRPTALLLLVALVAGLSGCDMARFTTGLTIPITVRGAPALQRLRDPDFAEEALPGTIGFLEALLEVKPDDMDARNLLARAYSSYAYGFLVERMERAEYESASEDVINHWRTRASLAFLRAREIGMGGINLMRSNDGGIMGAKERGLESYQDYVNHLDDKGHAELLFWTAYAWANYINLNRDDMDAVADLPYVSALAERVVQLDDSVYYHAPIALRAGIWGTLPAQLGGRPEEARTEFDRVIQLTERKNFTYMVVMARIVATAIQDRELYVSLLQEVIDGNPDVDPDQRLVNIVAQRRARRYLAEVDMLF